MLIRARIIGGGLLIAALAAVGCQSNSQLPAKLTGKITYKGAPVGGGTIAFFTADGQVISADIKNDGTFVSANLPEGTLTMTIETESVNPSKKAPEYRSAGGMSGMYGGKGPSAAKGGPKGGAPKSPMPSEGVPSGPEPTYVKIPAKYSDKEKSGLTVTVKKGDQKQDFDLTD